MSAMFNTDVIFGNATNDPAARGWFVGDFIDPAKGLRHSKDVELKWAVHAKGKERPEWATKEQHTTISLLISGKWEMVFRDQTVVLAKQGDYVMWGPGTDHKWQALEDTTLLTIRWPSVNS